MCMPLVVGLSLEKYWTKFELRESDLDFIYNLLLDREAPLTTVEMVSALINFRIERLQEEAQKEASDDNLTYRPGDEYQVGNQLVFPDLNMLKGTITDIRPGENPDIGSFDVIEVTTGDSESKRYFASRLENHKLNFVPESASEDSKEEVAILVLEKYGDVIISRLENRLKSAEDIVQIAGRWFPRALLADITEGHLNLAEAVLDVAEGGPLPTAALLKHVELPSDLDPLLSEFSMNYGMQEDQRFDEVGPAGKVLWYLRRMEPPEVLFTPPRIEYTPCPIDRSVLTEDLLALERSLDDELSPIEDSTEAADDEVTIALIFPHWRVGTLPLSSRLQPLFPTAYESPRILFNLIDGHNGEKFPGWVVRAGRYVFGLDEWYRRYEVPAGGLIKVSRGDEPGEIIVEAVKRRRRNEWIRTITINSSGRVGFTMLKQPVGASYDELMVIGLLDSVALDEAWLKGEQRKTPNDRLVAYVFRELAKLNPQTAVHAQALYSAVNVIKRLPPAAIFAELVTRSYYKHVGDLYWRFDDGQWSGA